MIKYLSIYAIKIIETVYMLLTHKIIDGILAS